MLTSGSPQTQEENDHIQHNSDCIFHVSTALLNCSLLPVIICSSLKMTANFSETSSWRIIVEESLSAVIYTSGFYCH